MSNDNNSTTASATLPKKEVKNINKEIQKHVRSIQRRLHKVACIEDKRERKLEAVAEPVTFCDRTRIEDRFEKKEAKQADKIVKHVTKVRDLTTKLVAAGLDPKEVVPLPVVQLLRTEPTPEAIGAAARSTLPVLA